MIINGSEMVTNLILLLLPFSVSSCILHQAGLNARQWTLFMPLYAALIRDISLKFFHIQQVLITLIFSPELLIKPLNLHIVLKPLIDILSVKELTVQC